jgi:VanZ family protein
MQKTAALPLALLYLALVVYASLYPFAEWRDQGIPPWAFLLAPVSHYWSGFDVVVNLAGYAPLAGLLTLTFLRTDQFRHPVVVAVLCAALASLCMETIQSYLPVRVPSREDFLFNTLGALMGATCAWVLEKMGAIDRWSRVRRRWFVADARGGLVLLITWPVALLFPAAVPFGLGQVADRLKVELQDYLQNTSFQVPMDQGVPGPMLATTELGCVALGILIPCLLGYCIIRRAWRRFFFLLALLLVGIAVSTLSAAMSWGPAHAWAWLDQATRIGIAIAFLAGALLIAIPWRVSAALLLLSLGVYLSVLNQAPGNAYFALTLQSWEQGRFIRFHGLAQWIGWLWPYATLLYVLGLVGRRDRDA